MHMGSKRFSLPSPAFTLSPLFLRTGLLLCTLVMPLILLGGCVGTKFRLNDPTVDLEAPFPSLHTVPDRVPDRVPDKVPDRVPDRVMVKTDGFVQRNQAALCQKYSTQLPKNAQPIQNTQPTQQIEVPTPPQKSRPTATPEEKILKNQELRRAYGL